MKNYRQIFLLFPIVSLLSPSISYASESQVSVQSTINSTSTSSTVNTGNTHIRIETNGVVKECDSKNGDCTHMESDDGSSKVQVNNNTLGTSTIDTEDEITVSPNPHSSNSAKTIISEQKKLQKAQQHTFLEEIEDFFKSIFDALKFKL